MRQTSTHATVTLVLFAGLALLSPGLTVGLKADDQIDKKVVDLVKQTGDFYKNAKSFHVEATIVSKVEGGGEKRDINVKAIYDIERPNRLSLKTELNGDSTKGPDVVADGKKLTVHGKGRKQYVEKDSPSGLAESGSNCCNSTGDDGDVVATCSLTTPLTYSCKASTRALTWARTKWTGRPSIG